MTLAGLLEAEAAQGTGSSHKAVINIHLGGGPSHQDMFDLKPEAPREFRGEFSPIATSVPGLKFCEIVPNLAKVANKLTIVRSICHKDPNHGGGNHYMMTGAPTPVPVGCGAFMPQPN